MPTSLTKTARWAALYLAVELTAVILLIHAVGLGWALLVLAAVFLAGVLLAAAQTRSALATGLVNPRTAVTDGALIGLGTLLVFLPGVVSTVAGALLLAPPTRTAVRPWAQGLFTRTVARRLGAFAPSARGGRPGYIDGEVVDPVAALPIARPDLPAVR